MAEDLGEKSELPTDRRRSEAREEGQLARSQDLSSAFDLIAAFSLLAVFGTWFVRRSRAVVEHLLGPHVFGPGVTIDASIEAMTWAGQRAAILLLPFMAALAVLAYVNRVFQVGWIISFKPLTPKLNRLSPIEGTKRLFSLRSLVKTGVNVLKLTVIIAAVSIMIRLRFTGIASLPGLELMQVMAVLARYITEFVLVVLAVILVIGVVDFLYQRWQHTQDLKMTKQQVKDERKSMEGDAETKARRQRVARSVAMQRLSQAVPGADAIVTNPTHFAVAIKYDKDNMEAPRVVAKGGDAMAMRIREIAAAHRIPIVERPALARALFAKIEIGRAITPEFYEAVAEILAYVYRLKGNAA